MIIYVYTQYVPRYAHLWHRSRRRPVEGAKNDGVKGFVKGIGTGFVSGMVKGVTGIKEPWHRGFPIGFIVPFKVYRPL